MQPNWVIPSTSPLLWLAKVMSVKIVIGTLRFRVCAFAKMYLISLLTLKTPFLNSRVEIMGQMSVGRRSLKRPWTKKVCQFQAILRPSLVNSECSESFVFSCPTYIHCLNFIGQLIYHDTASQLISQVNNSTPFVHLTSQRLA